MEHLKWLFFGKPHPIYIKNIVWLQNTKTEYHIDRDLTNSNNFYVTKQS